LLILIPLWLSLAVHEWAHAWCANALGDDTAARLGRLTLDPLAHVDPVGTLALPLLGVPFGWAKPVPVEPLRFRPGVPMGRGMLLTAAAGPLSNAVVAGICSTARLATAPGVGLGGSSLGGALDHLLRVLVGLNLALALFNLLPVPPLDGSRIVDALVSPRWRPLWNRFCAVGPFLLLALFVLPGLLGRSLLRVPP
jgi:Zn-dependent protease